MLSIFQNADCYMIGRVVHQAYFEPLLNLYTRLCFVIVQDGDTWQCPPEHRIEFRSRTEAFTKSQFAEGLVDWLIEHGMPHEFADHILAAQSSKPIYAGTLIEE